MLGQPTSAPARHIVLTDPMGSKAFLWADRSVEELYRSLKDAPARKELEDMLVVRQLVAELEAKTHATIRPTGGSARFYALLQRLTTMLDIVMDSWHVAPLRLRITNLTDMLDSRLLLDDKDSTSSILCTAKMRTVVSDRLQKNVELTTRKFSGRGNDKDDEDSRGKATTRGKRGGGNRKRASASHADTPKQRRSPTQERERDHERSRARHPTTGGDNSGAKRGAAAQVGGSATAANEARAASWRKATSSPVPSPQPGPVLSRSWPPPLRTRHTHLLHIARAGCSSILDFHRCKSPGAVLDTTRHQVRLASWSSPPFYTRTKVGVCGLPGFRSGQNSGGSHH